MSTPIRAVHYLNQHFGGLGAEERAGIAPRWFDGARGPGRLIEQLVPELEIIGTAVAGDDYVASKHDAAADEIVALIENHTSDRRPDVVIAGPAFNAGRYGLACAAVCAKASARLGVPAVTALYPENPAVAVFRGQVDMVRAGDDVLSMREAAQTLARAGLKLARGGTLVPSEDGAIAHGIRQNYFAERQGAQRAIDMLLRKLAGKAFETEYAMPVFDRVPPAPPLSSAARATIALVTSGGIVPRGNPDRIEAASASRFGAYSVEGLDALSSTSHQCVHGGYDPTFANADPNRVVPLDEARALQRDGRIGRLHDTYYATVGNATSVANARRYGAEIAAKLVNEGVQAVIFTST